MCTGPDALRGASPVSAGAGMPFVSGYGWPPASPAEGAAERSCSRLPDAGLMVRRKARKAGIRGKRAYCNKLTSFHVRAKVSGE